MFSLRTYSAIIIFFTIIHSISATGNLQLTLTSSHDCVIKLTTSSLHSEHFHLAMGKPRVVSFHSLVDHETLQVIFSLYGGAPQEHTYEMRKSPDAGQDFYVFGEVVVLVQSSFECDSGFTGSRCQRIKVKGTKSSTTTTSSVSPTTVSTSTSIPSSRSFAVISVSNYVILHIILAIALAVLFILLVVVLWIVCRRRTVRLDSETVCESAENNSNMSTEDDSGIGSGLSYTTATFTTVTITSC
ncbi:CUB domain-containing protein [Caenorhabditis elegans]|uniref:CUB domain-containing protein n=1 Tax=Caenorhabditis elegans TaxID=6239 RepID=Q20982_CAEEL|nr:CUB domain-containing protein [Caenorhabditis elegans]CAA94776.1 CUB domain-containing protein [Caenorhabditis elegans]|eukprot:NP_505515.1 Uncharacterized protein CELE_F58E6.6 [Caenorhabditis elegans]